MNDIDISLKIISEPREVATTATSTVLKIDVVAPPASYNKVETILTLDVYGKQKEFFSAATEAVELAKIGLQLSHVQALAALLMG